MKRTTMMTLGNQNGDMDLCYHSLKKQCFILVMIFADTYCDNRFEINEQEKDDKGGDSISPLLM